MKDDEKNLPPLDSTEGSVLRVAAGMQRYALLPSLAMSVVTTVVGAILFGAPGAVGAVIGAAIIIGGGLLVLLVMRKTATQPPATVMAAAMATYLGKFILLLVFGFAFKTTGLFNVKMGAYSMLAVLVVWTVGEVIGFRRTKVLTLITGSTGPTS
jgi:ATP synthase protein I